MKKINKIANIFIVIIILFLFMLTCYLFLHGELSRNRAIIGFLFIIALILFSVSLRWPVEWKINLLLFCGSIGFSIYFIEFYLYFFNPTADYTPFAIANIAKKYGTTNYDTRTKIQVVKDLRLNGIDAYPTIHPDMLFTPVDIIWDHPEIFPLTGISNKHSVFCNESGQFISYKSDEHGFNNKDGLYNHPIQVVLIGDSFTQGGCVKPEDNFSGNLEKHNYQVLNLGNGGSGPLFEYAIFKEYVTILKPEIILWFYYENDMDDLLKEKKIPVLLYYLKDSFFQNLLHQQKKIDLALSTFINKQISNYTEPGINIESLFKLWELRSRLNLMCKADAFSVNQQKLFCTILEKTKEAASAWNSKLYFIYLPGYYSLTSKDTTQYNLIRKLVKKINIPFIDIYNLLSLHNDPESLFPFRLPLHYNEEGYRIISNAIVRFLDKNK
jgi:lysophospholipase L1-like esterase